MVFGVNFVLLLVNLLFMKKSLILILLFFYFQWGSAQSTTVPFTLEDRDRLLKIEQKLNDMEKRFDDRFQQNEGRFQQMEKRFEERFLQIEKRLDEMRADMNARFEQQYTFSWIFSAIFTAMLVAVFGFAYWDRKTFIKPIESKVSLLEKALENELKTKENTPNLKEILKDFAKIDSRFAEILKQHNIL
ncbi:hypothetical protein Rain11_2242 [Raineya orbicola]|uniref:Uncharacterized protein n=2 Tax=Raineya orbicola TaxID=2016530 RepID=A0A2N3I937_9BACT|nr:hypothetical protein Rain11_2242 [Raineya orbicola]